MVKKGNSYFFYILLTLILLLTFFLIKPFYQYILLAIIIAAAMYPLNKWLNKKIKNGTITSVILLIFVLLVIIIPSSYFVSSLINQASIAYNSFDAEVIDETSSFVSSLLSTEVDLRATLINLSLKLRDYLINAFPAALGSAAETIIGLFLLFFTLFYLFKDGDKLKKSIITLIPLKKKYSDELAKRMNNVIQAVITGQLVTAIIQGLIGGIGFAIFGIPNPVFWGFIMAILSFLPVVGASLVWAPGGIILILTGNYFAGIGLLIYGFFVMNITDNIVRPALIGDRSKIHPAVILIGVVGGIKVFGIIGLITGPLILGFLLAMLEFYRNDRANL